MKKYSKQQIEESIKHYICEMCNMIESKAGLNAVDAVLDEFNAISDDNVKRVFFVILLESIGYDDFSDFVDNLLSNDKWFAKDEIKNALHAAKKAVKELNNSRK